MKLGILKTDDVRESLVDEFGEYPDMFQRIIHEVDASVECIEYDVLHFDYPDDIDEVDAYLITGSKASVYDDDAWILRLGEFIQELDIRKKKLIGICFGHQLVAHVLGGKTEKSGVGWLIGRQRHELNQEGVTLTGTTDGFDILCSHQDQVTVPAKDAVTLASSAQCPFAMCCIGDHILTFQGHPEFTEDYATRLFEIRRDQLGDTLVDDAFESMKIKVDSSLFVKWILEFIG